MVVKGKTFYAFYCFFTAIFAVQSYFAYHGRAFDEAVLYGIASVSSVGLILYALSTRKPKPPVV